MIADGPNPKLASVGLVDKETEVPSVSACGAESTKGYWLPSVRKEDPRVLSGTTLRDFTGFSSSLRIV